MFNLYFAGPIQAQYDEILERGGDHVLLSYMIARSQIKKRHEAERMTFIDSGAFTAHTKGVVVDVDAYIEFLNTYDASCSIAAQVDKIPGEYKKPKTKQQLLEAPELSWENYVYMRDKLNSPDKLLPIFHQGEDFKHLVRILDCEPKIPYIGISPANDVMRDQKATWCEKVWKIIHKSNNPKVKTHAFGMTSIDLLEKYPWYSADSATWTLAAAYGKILLDLRVKGEEYTVSIKNPNNEISKSGKRVEEAVRAYVESKGYKLEDLQTDMKARRKWNLEYMVDWAVNYEYKPKKHKQRSLLGGV